MRFSRYQAVQSVVLLYILQSKIIIAFTRIIGKIGLSATKILDARSK